MAGPWEKYGNAQSAPTTSADGPWAKYGSQSSIQPQQGDIVVTPANGTFDDTTPAASGAQDTWQGIKRQLAMSASNLGQGAIGLGDLIATPIRAGLNAVLPDKYHIGTGAESIAHYAQSAVPDVNLTPQSSAENYISAINRGVGGAVTGIGTGNAIAGAANPVIAGVGNTLASNPLTQIASAATGATAGEAARQAGGNQLVQIGASILGGLAPAAPQIAATATRNALGASSANQAATAQRIADFEALGANPTAAQATGSGAAQYGEKLSATLPGGATVYPKAAEAQAKAIGQGVENIAAQMGPKMDNTTLGNMIQKGITGEGGFIDRFKSASNDLYNKLGQYVQPSEQVPITNTQKALSDLTSTIEGAPNTSKFFQNAKINDIRNTIAKDVQSNQPSSVMGGTAFDSLPYEAISKLRTQVGDALSDAGIGTDLPRSQFKRLYAALSQDLESAVKSKGPEAEAAWNNANSFYKAGQDKIDQLSSVVDRNGGPEKVFTAAISGTKDGATTLDNVMSALNPDEQRMLSAAVARRLGAPTPGKAGLDDTFSPESFLTRWNAMSPEAKQSLFGRFGDKYQADMDRVARVADVVRNSNDVLRNPSGTAPLVANASALSTILATLGTGHILPAIGVATGTAANYAGAKLMTNPNFVRWLSMSSTIPVQGLPAAINSLDRMAKEKKDPQLQAAADQLKQASNNDQNANQEQPPQ